MTSTPDVVFSKAAIADIDEIWTYIADNSNMESADRFLTTIRDKCSSLVNSPKGFRLRPELSSLLRSYPIKRYVVFYQEIEKGIQIVRILHSARDIDAIFE